MNKPVEKCVDGIPLPIVRLNRVVLVSGVLLAFVLQAPVIIAALFAVIAPAAIWGRRASLIFKIGSRLFAKQNAGAEQEDHRLMRFNNSIAALMLGGATVAFVLNVWTVGWILSFGVAAAALVALLGFCVGCFLYYQFRLQRTRLFGAAKP
jgi:hypothetical protein